MAGAWSSALSPSRTKAGKWVRAFAIGLAVAYPAVLLLLVLLFRFAGEEWWATALALYLPRWLMGVPFPFAVAVLLVYKERRLLVTQAVAGILLVFPLMGFVFPWFSGKSDDEPVVRV